MCKTNREATLKEIAKANTKLLDQVIKYINTKLNVDLYEIKKSNNNSNLELVNKKNKAFYKQVIKRVLNLMERYSMKERLLLEEIEKGQKLVNMKKALTVKSPSVDSEVFAQSLGNSQEAILIEIGEEIEKQKARIKKYDSFVKTNEKAKALMREFVELSTNTAGVEVTIRHFFEGQDFKSIAEVLHYEEVYYLWKRVVDELAVILMFDL